ncbi:N amino acid transport system protein [Jaminaea rosea]|uniref:N amino acid transport system protein n=1 Tax=Jaminaea rosea TaxID=1569628 RepID=A0A316UI51_9BASI|nr:N amino acid transport system protein [Jaminaea rosea]PWN24584.1 N amino acid transport system protein [Jaminaea rosea]
MNQAGEAGKFHKLSWLRLTSVMIVEAIALGSLSMPASFATLGLVPALLIVIGMGIISYVCSIHIGRTWLANREMTSYPMAGELLFVRMFGEGGRKTGRYFTTTIFLLLLIFTTGSHALTGRLMFNALSDNAICQVGFSAISAIILFILALPKTFNEMGWLGYVDFASIVIAIIITIIGSGVEGSQRPGGLDAVQWYAVNPEAPTFASAFLAVTNITFAYAYAQCQFSFMSELKRPREYTKSVGLLVSVEMVIYCLTGSLIYRFSGQQVESPALLGLSPTLSKVAFGVAIPVIFISGSINSVTAGRFIYDWKYKGTRHELINTKQGNIAWVGIIAVITIIAWLVAELIPIFSALLGIISAAFISFFSYTFPALFYIYFLRDGSWNASMRNMVFTVLNILIAVGGLFIVVAGIYASAIDIKEQTDAGTVGKPFSCAA